MADEVAVIPRGRPTFTVLKDRYRRFADAYSRHGVAYKAAIEAGFSEKASHSTASRLLRRAKIRELIEAKNVQRGVHVEQTYRDLILVGQTALALLAQIVKDPNAPNKDKIGVVECAGRALERLARVEGLINASDIFAGKNQTVVNLQQLVQVYHEKYGLPKETTTTLASVTTSSEPPAQVPVVIDAEIVPAPLNGNGHANGNGHS